MPRTWTIRVVHDLRSSQDVVGQSERPDGHTRPGAWWRTSDHTAAKSGHGHWLSPRRGRPERSTGQVDQESDQTEGQRPRTQSTTGRACHRQRGGVGRIRSTHESWCITPLSYRSNQSNSESLTRLASSEPCYCWAIHLAFESMAAAQQEQRTQAEKAPQREESKKRPLEVDESDSDDDQGIHAQS